MKKSFLTVALVLCMLACLTACGKTQSAPQPTPSPAPAAPTLESVLPGGNLSSADSEESAASEVVIDPEMLTAAQSCIDKSVDELYAVIGEPADSSYAPSCINPGKGEDGELYYEGFTVATYREGEKETVREVTINAG